MNTDFGALDIMQKRVWSGKLWKAYRDNSFWLSNSFVDQGMNSPIQQITDLTATERGNEVVMSLVLDLEGDGTVGDAQLDGNEEPLVNDAQTIKIDMLRHGVRSKGRMAEQATVIRFRSEGKDKLGYWLSNKLDELMFLTASGLSYSTRLNGATRTNSQLPALKFAGDVSAPSANRKKYVGSATSTSLLTASDKMSWATIVTTNQFLMDNGVRPIRSNGDERYAYVLSPSQWRDLTLDPVYMTNAGRAAANGNSNPLFKGGITTIDGAIIYKHRKVANTSGLTSGNKWGSGGTVEGAQAIAMGAQALGFATIGNAWWAEAEITDYGNRPGIAYGRMFGLLKPKFKSPSNNNSREDFGTVSLYTAASR